MGSNWLDFLLSCKVFIGCEGGSSLLDFDGEIKNKVLDYSMDNPDATFEEIEQKCFPGLDFNTEGFMLSPRHFECATTKTSPNFFIKRINWRIPGAEMPSSFDTNIKGLSLLIMFKIVLQNYRFHFNHNPYICKKSNSL